MGDQSPVPRDGFSDELSVHTVTVSAFYMRTTEVTYAQWLATHTYATANGYTFDGAGSGKVANHPVHSVAMPAEAMIICFLRSASFHVSPTSVYRKGQSTRNAPVTAASM